MMRPAHPAWLTSLFLGTLLVATMPTPAAEPATPATGSTTSPGAASSRAPSPPDPLPAGPAAVLATPDASLPVDLDAEFSEFDRRNNRLVFRRLTVRQGLLSIKADEATADPADFIRSRWLFKGNVVIRNAEAQVQCATAELTYRDNVLRQAVLTGKPARFTQPRTAQRLPTEGSADRLDYDPVNGKIRLSGNARLADASNDIRGERIDYDLRREVVSAGAGGGGPVRIRIAPGERISGPAPPPASKPAPKSAPKPRS
jgi:lipopolysaccharide export system protein LptA